MVINTYTQKREIVQAHRLICDWFFSFFDCGGPIPTMENNKADEHKDGCPYRVRIENQKEIPCNTK